MRISDIIKKGDQPKKRPVQPPREEVKARPKSVQPPSPPPPVEEETRQESGIYEELVVAMESVWFKLENKKELEVGPLKELIIKFVKGFKDNQDPLINVNGPYPVSDNYLPYHSVNVCVIATALGVKLGHKEIALADLSFASIMHDVGMARVPRATVFKKEELTDVDWEKIKQHPAHSKKILEDIKGITRAVLLSVSQSHERQNGGGYPSKMKNGEIHDFAKIIGLSDTYEAFTHDRVHRKAVSPYKAIREILRKDGELFPPVLLKSLIEVITFYPLGSFVQLSTGEIGVVREVSANFPMRPVVEIILDEKRDSVPPGKKVNLSAQPFISIKKILKKENIGKYSKAV